MSRRTSYRRYYRRPDRLTGGTKDVNPQIFRTDCVMTANNTTESFSFKLPISPISQVTSSRANIVEIMKIDCWFHSQLPTPVDANFHDGSQKCAVTTRDHGATDVVPSASDCIAFFKQGYMGSFTAGGTGYSYVPQPMSTTFHDGAGHGFIVATDTIYVQLQDTDIGTQKVRVILHVHYRYKNVGLTEYIGVVTGQVAGQTT